MVLVPQEAARIRIPLRPAVDAAHLEHVDSLLATGAVEDAFAAGDEKVLGSMTGMTPELTSWIRDGADELRRWRSKRRLPGDDTAQSDGVLVRVS